MNETTRIQQQKKLETPPIFDEVAAVFEVHGCEIVEYAGYCVVTFPEGTTRTEIFPRLYNVRYQITLPDGFQVREIYDRCREQSLLFLLS
jgi:hypothetical protein